MPQGSPRLIRIQRINRLQNKFSLIHPFINKVNRGSDITGAITHRVPETVQSLEGRQQGWVKIDDSMVIFLQQFADKQFGVERNHIIDPVRL